MDSLSHHEESRRQFLLYLLSIGAFAAVPGCSTSRSPSAPKQMPANRSIYRLKGDVRVNGQPADLETLVSPGDTVETLKESYVIFVVNKDAFIVRSNSRMEIAEAGSGDTFSLPQGKALSVLASRETRITTPSAVIGIRGTGIYVESEPDRSYVCTCYGTSDLSTADDPNIKETITAEHHDEPRYILADTRASRRIQPAPFKNHDDQELLLIETLVGRTTPFVVPGGINRSRSTYY